jgi:hypothetical protein
MLRLKVELTLKLDFVLDNKSFALVIDFLWELGRDCMMGSGILYYETLIALNALENMRLFHSPFSNIGPFFIFVRALGILLRMRWLPSCLPVVCELFDKITLYLGRLCRWSVMNKVKLVTPVGRRAYSKGRDLDRRS